jgi:MoxR-like ATPase
MMPKINSVVKQKLVNAIVAKHGCTVNRKQVLEFAAENGVTVPQWLLNNPELKVGRGQYNLAPLVSSADAVSSAMPAAVVTPITQAVVVQQKRLQTQVDNAVPEKDADYVPFGFHSDLQTIIGSKIFYPVFISGLSGNGKTFMVEQVCASLGREVYRVNISVETDEDSLVGGHTLVDGNVVYREGPALMAMRRGAVLLLDEIDRGSNKLICLQAILEGKPYFNKKTGEMVYPQKGFNVVATANTKGQGSDDGKFAAAQILDEAFLERFAISYEQSYPENRIEKKIVLNSMKKLDCMDQDFADKLIAWADIIRKTYEGGGIDDIVSTRRLVNIVQAFAMFKDKMKAITLCVNRFDAETKAAFIELYTKMEEPAAEVPAAPAEAVAEQA